jgi:hypothetical protein
MIGPDRTNIVFDIPVKHAGTGEVIGTATLKPTGANGIYIAEMMIHDGTATGYVHVPVREGDSIDTMYVKEEKYLSAEEIVDPYATAMHDMTKWKKD